MRVGTRFPAVEVEFDFYISDFAATSSLAMVGMCRVEFADRALKRVAARSEKQ